MPQLNLAANENEKVLILRLQIIDHKPQRVLTSLDLNHLTSFRLSRALGKIADKIINCADIYHS